MSLLTRPSRPSRTLLPTSLLLISSALAAFASQAVSVRWTANPETDISHYKVLYGTSATSLDQSVNAGDATSTVIGGLADDTAYYFALQAVNTADMASEVSAAAVFRTAGGATPVPAPELVIRDASGTEFTAGTATLDFAAIPTGGTTTLTLTLSNVGNATLSSIAATLAGPDADDFSIDQAPSATVAAGGQTALRISFSPVATGVRAATLRIASDDADENPFVIALAGTGSTPPPVPQPEIVVETSSGNALVSGAASLDLGSQVQGTSSAAAVLTIRNTGTAALTGISSSVTGGHAGDFLVSAPAASVATGESTTFTVRFQPSAAGTRSAVLQIASNDGDDNPFVIALSGTGTTPPPAPQPEIVVETGGGNALVAGTASLDLGSQVQGTSSAAAMLTIRNIGTAALTGIVHSVTGGHAGDFLISTPAVSVAAGESTTFTVRFQPSAAGPRSAVLQIASNDADENPFVISLAGTGTTPPPAPQPEIVVETSGGNALVAGAASLDLGSQVQGTNSAATVLTIRNTGTAALAGLAAAVSGSHAGDFTLLSTLPSSVAAGGSATVSFRFRPSAVGKRSAILTIASNDADEGSFVIQLTGTGLAVPTPEIVVEHAGTSLVDGSAALGFGSVIPGNSSAALTLTIRNTGTATLTGIATSLTGGHAGDFLVSAPATSLAAGGNTTFTVRFQPTTVGPRSAVLRIASNDADENPFDITLGGTGLAVPEIDVLAPDGAPMAGASASLSFGSVAVRDGSRRLAITIRNSGTAALGGISASVSGTHAAEFSIETAPPATLAPGGETTLAIVFRPAGSGTRSASLKIASNDADEGNFLIALAGSGAAVPQIEVFRVIGPVAAAPGSSGFGEVTLGSRSAGVTYAIHNAGTATLADLALGFAGVHAGDFVTTTLRTSVLAPGETAEFTLHFAPRQPGERNALLQVFSNDPYHNPVELPVSGIGIGVPEIDVRAENGNASLIGGATDFGSADIGVKGREHSFVIRNTGSGTLRNVRVSRTGAAAADFTILTAPAATILPGGRQIVRVRFQPRAAGERRANLHIHSDDRDEAVVDIPLTGKGIARAELRVSLGKARLVNGKAYVAFGRGEVGRKSETRTLTITNTGTAPLTGLAIRKNWLHAGDFQVGKLRARSLAPGKSVSMKLVFRPKTTGNRWAAVKILSNAPGNRSFEVLLNGVGADHVAKPPKNRKKKLATRPNSGANRPDGTKLVVHAGGQRFRAIKILKSNQPGVRPRDIEVSGDLLEWSSGSRHTTVVRDDDEALIVRDNTPLGDGKRHIRLNPRR